MGVLLKLHFPRRRFGGGFFVGGRRLPHKRLRSPRAESLTDTVKASIRDHLAILRDSKCPEVDDDVYDRLTALVVASVVCTRASLPGRSIRTYAASGNRRGMTAALTLRT
jgi:hypothetical protein